MAVIIKERGLDTLVTEGVVKLRYLVDIDELVIKNEYIKKGHNIGNVDVGLITSSYHASASDDGISIGDMLFDLHDAEMLYVIFVHELIHHLQFITRKLSLQDIISQTRYESDEREARWWEALQAAKFGWDEKEYKRRWARDMRAEEKWSGEKWHKEARKERPWAFYAVRRRPIGKVSVGMYRRKADGTHR